MPTNSLYPVDELEALLAGAPAPAERASTGAAGVAAPSAEPLPTVDTPDHPRDPALGGLGLALLSALAFATSGSFAKSLLDSGWSPGAAVLARIGGAALVLTIPAALALRGRWSALRTNAGTVLGYGVIAVAFSQLFYFNAVSHLSVGVALLLEYLSPVLLVGLVWARTRRHPPATTLLGCALALGGLALVIDLFGGLSVDPAGLAWGLLAACCSVAYYVLGARRTRGLPPIALAWAGMVVASGVLGTAGLLGLMPVAATAADVRLVGIDAPVWVPVLGLTLVAGALSYTTGIAAARRLGSTVASFVSLTEVCFAIAIAFVLLGEVPTSGQLLGGLAILSGVVAVKFGDARA